jgi:receptor-type tyrosine-protein phosphatase gamma
LFTLPVLSFIRRSSACNPETGGPIVVHCSAGVGRTGTYIVVDTMLKKIREQHALNIPSFLKHIRQQRNFLVQTEEQFVFIYDVLLEAIHLLTIGYNDLELNEQNFDYIIQMLDYFDNDSNLTRLDKQYQLINVQTKFNDYQWSTGQLEENFVRNRTQAILPFNACRVMLSTERKSNGTEYINASYIHVSIDMVNSKQTSYVFIVFVYATMN